ncbi:hypothetical protein DV736_g636, partial [Chaetothyriales sp. CBS 134916]
MRSRSTSNPSQGTSTPWTGPLTALLSEEVLAPSSSTVWTVWAPPRKRPIFLTLLTICIGMLIADVVFNLASLQRALTTYEIIRLTPSNQVNLRDDSPWVVDNSNILALVSFSKQSRAELLDCYLQQNLVRNGGLLDRIIFIPDTEDYEELEWLKRTVSQVDGYHLLSAGDPESDQLFDGMDEKLVPFSEASAIRTSLGKSWKVAHSLSRAMQASGDQREPLWLFIGAETIYMCPEMVASLLETHQTRPEYALVHANMVNQQTLSWIHNKLGAAKPYRPEGNTAKDDLSSEVSPQELNERSHDEQHVEDVAIARRIGPASAWRASELPLWSFEHSIALESTHSSYPSPMLFGVPVDFNPPPGKHRWLPFDSRAYPDPSVAETNALDFRQRPPMYSRIKDSAFDNSGPGIWPWTVFTQQLYSFLEHLEEEHNFRVGSKGNGTEIERLGRMQGLARYQFPLWACDNDAMSLSLFLVSSADIDATMPGPNYFPYEADELEMEHWLLKNEITRINLHGREAIVDGHAVAARFAPDITAFDSKGGYEWNSRLAYVMTAGQLSSKYRTDNKRLMASAEFSAEDDGRIATLRQVAQQHLQEIHFETKKEQEQETQRIAELEHETRRRMSARLSNQPSSSEPKSKTGRMRTAQDVLNRLRWADGADISQYHVGYLDRFGGCLERSAAAWISDSTEEEWIPQHRIRYFKKTTAGVEEIVWDRDRRIDKVFGSTVVYDWPQHKDVLYNFYIMERRSLEDIMQHMRDVFNFTPSKRAYQTQFKRWGFPSKQNPAHRNLDLVERVRQLWEANYSQRDMLKTLNDEGYQLKERELMRLRAKNRWLLRIPNGMKQSDVDETDLNTFQNDLLDPVANIPVENVQALASAEPGSEENAELSEILRKRKERHDQMKAESDDRYASKKRRRRTREYAGIPADPPGPPRFPSETTLEESKAILSLDLQQYRAMRDQFQTICEEEQVIKKTLAGNEKWSHVKDRLIHENEHMQQIFLQETDPAARASKDLALDVIATDVTKRMRGIGRRMTIVEAKNALHLNPEQSRQVRNSFYTSLQNDRFSSKLETGAEHWEELKKQWLMRTPLLLELFKDGEADPEYEQKHKALEALCRDVMKRLRDDQSKRKKNPDQATHPRPQRSRLATAPTGPVATAAAANKALAAASQQPAPSPYQFTQDLAEMQIDPSLLEAAGNFADPISTPVPVYIRPHVNSQIHKDDKLWLASLTTSSMQELRNLLTTKWPDATFAQIEAVAKDPSGQEMFYVVDSDEELEAYFDHVSGNKAVLVVLLNKK